jgi:hypothetical protein
MDNVQNCDSCTEISYTFTEPVSVSANHIFIRTQCIYHSVPDVENSNITLCRFRSVSTHFLIKLITVM